LREWAGELRVVLLARSESKLAQVNKEVSDSGRAVKSPVRRIRTPWRESPPWIAPDFQPLR